MEHQSTGITRSLDRRDFMKLALAVGIAGGTALTFSGCASGTSSNNTSSTAKITVNKDQVENLSVALLGKDIKIACLLIAKQEGFFEEEKLNVTYHSLQNLNDAMSAVSTGQVDVLPFGVIPSSTFIGQGSDVVIFGGTVAEGSEAISTPANKSAFKSVEDFKGKKLGCFRMETGHMVMKGVLREGGLNVDQNDPKKDVTFVQLDSSASIVAAVQNGSIDLGFVNSGYGYVAQQGGAAVAFKVGEWKQDFPCCRQTTNRTFFDNNKSALVKFETALLRGYDIFRNDHEKAIADLVAYSGQSADYVTNVMYGTSTYSPAMIIEMDPYTDQVCDFYKTMIANGDIDASTPYKMEDHIDSKIYSAALQEMTSRGQSASLYKELEAAYTSHNTIGA